MSEQKGNCSKEAKERMRKKHLFFTYKEVFLVGFLGSLLFMFGFCFVYMFISLVDSTSAWLGWLIGLIVSFVFAILVILHLNLTFKMKEKNLERMKKCGEKPKDVNIKI